jgi:hypothetical protein
VGGDILFLVVDLVLMLEVIIACEMVNVRQEEH